MKKILALVAVVMLAAACKTFDNKEPPPKPFTGTRWQFVLEAPPEGERPWLRFGDGRMSGFGGCNRLGADYMQDSVGSRFIVLKRIELLGRACDQETMATQRRLLSVLQDVSSYSITADTMKMSGSAGTLTFLAVGPDGKPLTPPKEEK